MALLRLLCSPATAYLPTEQRNSLTPLSSLHSPHCLSKNTQSHVCLSCSLSPIFPLSQTHTRKLSFRIKKRCNFVLQFSSAAQEQVLESPPVSVANVSGELEPETEEFSNTRLVAQNVPWTCTPEDIRSVFEKYGAVLDVELSMYNKTKNRGLAFVSMGSPEEALAALNNLESYELEGRTIKVNYAKVKKKKPATPVQPKPSVTFNLFVANLSYETRAKDLKEFFSSGGSSVVSAEVIFHENPRRSLGYGFVSFKSKKEAEEAIAAFQGKLLLGRPIRVARSRQFVKHLTEDTTQSGDTSINLISGAGQAETDDKDEK